MEDYDNKIDDGEKPIKNWDELLAHFKSLQEKLERAEREITRLNERTEYLSGRAGGLEDALRFLAEGLMRGRN